VHGVLLQDWTTLRFTAATPSVTQSKLTWLDVDGYRDVVFWLEVKGLILGGGTAVVLSYQTSPSRDEDLFGTMTSFPLSVTSTPFITKVLDVQNPTRPLAKWLRWSVRVAGTPSSECGLTFRIHCALNASGGP
jgi:hypothetical protein